MYFRLNLHAIATLQAAEQHQFFIDVLLKIPPSKVVVVLLQHFGDFLLSVNISDFHGFLCKIIVSWRWIWFFIFPFVRHIYLIEISLFPLFMRHNKIEVESSWTTLRAYFRLFYSCVGELGSEPVNFPFQKWWERLFGHSRLTTKNFFGMVNIFSRDEEDKRIRELLFISFVSRALKISIFYVILSRFIMYGKWQSVSCSIFV